MGDEYCAAQIHACTKQVVTYLDQLAKKPIIPEKRGGSYKSKKRAIDSLPRKDEREQIREQFALPKNQLETAIQLIEGASFEGRLISNGLGKLRDLLDVLERGTRVSKVAGASALRTEARKLATQLQEEVSRFVQTSPEGIKIHVLLLSDLHAGHGDPRQSNVEELFFDDLANAFYGRAFDLVVFCGDLVFSGKEFSGKEFQSFDNFLGRLWQRLPSSGVNPPFVTVPGNHDVFQLGEDYKIRLANMLKSKPSEIVANIFETREETEAKAVIADALRPYRVWRQKNLDHQKWERKPALGTYHQSEILGDFSFTLEKDGAKLGIVGLDSAFLHLRKDANCKGKLYVDLRQLIGVCGNDAPGWIKKHDGCLLVTHHPVDWLEEECRPKFESEILGSGFFLHVHGHMHAPDIQLEASHGRKAMTHLQVPSLFGLEKCLDKSGIGPAKEIDRKHGYTVLEIIVGEQSTWYRHRTRIRAKTGAMIDAHDFVQNLSATGWSYYERVPRSQ